MQQQVSVDYGPQRVQGTVGHRKCSCPFGVERHVRGVGRTGSHPDRAVGHGQVPGRPPDHPVLQNEGHPVGHCPACCGLGHGLDPGFGQRFRHASEPTGRHGYGLVPMMGQRSKDHDEQWQAEVGRGQKTYDFGTVHGQWRRLEGPEDVLDLMDGEAGAEGVVAVVRDAGATFLGPIFDELAGVVCTGGTIRSHIGIISREYRVPGVIGMVFAVEGEEPVDGTVVELDGTGDDGIILIPAQ